MSCAVKMMGQTRSKSTTCIDFPLACTHTIYQPTAYPFCCTALTKTMGLHLDLSLRRNQYEILLFSFELWSCSVSKWKKSAWVISGTCKMNVQLIFPPKLLTTSRAFKGHSIYSSFFFKTILLTKHWLLSKKRENPWHVRFSSQLTVLVTYYRHILGFSRPKILLPKHFDSVWRKSGSAQDVAVKKK